MGPLEPVRALRPVSRSGLPTCPTRPRSSSPLRAGSKCNSAQVQFPQASGAWGAIADVIFDTLQNPDRLTIARTRA